jgi:hypothetical protein
MTPLPPGRSSSEARDPNGKAVGPKPETYAFEEWHWKSDTAQNALDAWRDVSDE